MASVVPSVSQALTRCLTPIAPFTGPSLPVLSALDFAGAFRLCVALRQFKASKEKSGQVKVEWVKDLWTTWTVLYGGEIIACLLLSSTPPSFLFSPTIPILFMFTHFIVQLLPQPPSPSLSSELPLAFVDAFNRSILLCNFAAPLVLNHPSKAVASSPLALLVIATIIANGGFFLVNALNMHSPEGWSLTTPPELKDGWTAVDSWCPILITGLYALLTHAQPYWAETYKSLGDMYGFKDSAWSPDEARAICAAVLVVLFTLRAFYNFGPQLWNGGAPRAEEKTKEKGE